MSAPRTSNFDTSVTYSWSNGVAFNGYIIVGVVIPTFDGTTGTVWPEIQLSNTNMVAPLPKGFAKIPIIQGRINGNLGLFYNADIVPPNTQYVYYIYDSNSRQIAGPSSYFTVTSATITLPNLVIGVPSTTNAVAPVPD